MRMIEIDSECSNDFRLLAELMDEDGHSLPSPTHLFVSHKGVIGACSLAYAPCLFFWMHSTRATKFDSYRAFSKATATLEQMGHSKPILIIENSSPFYEFLNRLGYSILGKGEIFMKG